MEASKQRKPTRLQFCLTRSKRVLHRITSKQREEQFTREEQLMMVVLGHALILTGVCVIMALLYADEWVWPPSGFWVLELMIIVLSYIAASATSASVISAIEKVGLGAAWLKSFVEAHRHWKDRIQSIVLLAVYVLQIAALVPLLKATGGPIDSPFAPMALAIAVFTPFIVNKWWTIGFIVLSTMVFYAVFVVRFGFGPETAQADVAGTAAVETVESRPNRGSFIAVNLFILGLASVMTLARRDSRSFTMTRTIGAPREDVWQYWTDPGCVADWFGGTNRIAAKIAMDVREGGTWSAAVEGPTGELSIPWTGTYQEVNEPERLVFTLNSRPDLGHDTVSVTLKEIDGRTEMIVRQSDDGRYKELEHGWAVFFDRMETQLRSGSNGKGDGPLSKTIRG